MTDDLDQIIDLATKWASSSERWILAHGRELSPPEIERAKVAGIIDAEKISICIHDFIPGPDDDLLKMVNHHVDLISDNTIGLTLGHGIHIRSACSTDGKLLIHGYVHVAQTERLRGIGPPLRCYLDEYLRFGVRKITA